jgi:hypothetical protein
MDRGGRDRRLDVEAGRHLARPGGVHFLVMPADRERYETHLRSTLKATGAAIIATFAPDGPAKCGALPVARYSPETLAAELGSEFEACRYGALFSSHAVGQSPVVSVLPLRSLGPMRDRRVVRRSDGGLARRRRIWWGSCSTFSG